MEISSLFFSWIKAVHLVAIVSWMVGLLYLPRLFIYHCHSEIGSEKSETFKIMERRLFRVIMNPSMFVSLLTGGMMTYSYGFYIFTELWFTVKIACLFGLLTVHMFMSKWRKDFEKDVNLKSQIYFRVINEVPTVLMILIIIMVVVKPF